MFNRYKSAVVAATAFTALSSSPAFAAKAITCDSLTNATSCSFFHNFGTSSPDNEATTGRGFDEFVFSIVGMKTLVGALGNFYQTIDQNVNFPAGGGAPTLRGGTLAGPVRWTTTSLGNPDTRAIGPILLGAGTYTVRVDYRTGQNGFYEGALSLVSAIPEPASWALMILGFGLVGGTLRARKRRFEMGARVNRSDARPSIIV